MYFTICGDAQTGAKEERYVFGGISKESYIMKGSTVIGLWC